MDTYDGGCTSRDLQVGGDELEGEFETGEEGGGEEGDVAAAFYCERAEDGEGDEEGAEVEGEEEKEEEEWMNAHARARVFPARAFVDCDFACFSSTAPSL